MSWKCTKSSLDIRERETNRSFRLLLEHDRGTEQQEHFRRRIQAYKKFLSSGAYKQALGINGVLVAFTTLLSNRVPQMREWTRAELASDTQLHHEGRITFKEWLRYVREWTENVAEHYGSLTDVERVRRLPKP